ncbi:MAG: penicillin-binding protein 2 [Terriglobales bacterium]
MAIRFHSDEVLPGGRLRLVQICLVAGFLGLILALWQLQILHQQHWAQLAQDNRIRSEPIPAPRGRILDRHGKVLVANYASFSALLIRQEEPHWRADLPAIAAGLHLDLGPLEQRLRRFASAPTYEPVLLKEDITQADVAFIDSHRDQFPELETVTISRRLYPSDGYAAQVVGYVGEATPADMARFHVAAGTLVGKSGLEEYYNKWLMGTDGLRRVVVNSRGQVMAKLPGIPPIQGHDLRTTLDATLQSAAEEAMGDRPGAVVALNPQNGQVLAMVSSPAFNANDFTLGISEKEWHALLTNPGHPLLNKAVQAELAPGSIFKIVTALAGLETGVAQHLVVDCKGGASFYGHYYKCWVPTGHGITRVSKALAQSCDVYFYTLGNELGIDKLAYYAKKVGLGRPTGIDLPHEDAGLIPTPAWKERRYHQPWYAGQTIIAAIGQGAIDTTPLQLARTIGGIAIGGKFFRPHLAFNGEVPAADHPADRQPREFSFPISAPITATITNALRNVVNPGGTAASAHLEGVDWGGKTGTAQTVSERTFNDLGEAQRQHFIDNAWFLGLYPVNDPTIAVCVLYQHGDHGYLAGYIASQVVEAYYQEQRGQAHMLAAGLTQAFGPADKWALLAASPPPPRARKP